MPPGIHLTAADIPAGELPLPPERREPAATVLDHTGTVVTLVFSPDGRLLVTGDDDDATIVWDVTDPAHPAPVARLPSTGTDTPKAARDPITAAPRAEGPTRHDRAGGPRPRRSPWAGQRLPWRGLAFGPYHRLLATGHRDGTTELWWLTDPAGPVRAAVLAPPFRRSGSVNTVAFSPDGRRLATGYENGVVLVWDVSDPARPTPAWTPLRRWGWRSEIFTVAFSPDQRILVVGGFRESRRPAILWDLTGTRPTRIAALRPPRGGILRGPDPFLDFRSSVFALAFSPDARSAAIAADQRTQVTTQYGSGPEHHDSMVILWDLADPNRPRLVATLTQRGGVRNLPRRVVRRHEATTYTGHTATARAVSFSPDGRLLATGSDDGTAILWDLGNPDRPHPVATLIRWAPIRALAFAPGGRVLATASGSTVALWNVP